MVIEYRVNPNVLNFREWLPNAWAEKLKVLERLTVSRYD